MISQEFYSSQGDEVEYEKHDYNNCSAGQYPAVYIEVNTSKFAFKEKYIMRENWNYRRGDIYLADLGEGQGSEQGGKRPVVVLQNDIGNHFSPNITIVPVTSKDKKPNQPTHFELAGVKGLDMRSTALGECLATIAKSRVIRYLGKLDDKNLSGVEEAVKAHLGFYIPACVELP